jgi:hypothetical protein
MKKWHRIKRASEGVAIPSLIKQPLPTPTDALFPHVLIMSNRPFFFLGIFDVPFRYVQGVSVLRHHGSRGVELVCVLQ